MKVLYTIRRRPGTVIKNTDMNLSTYICDTGTNLFSNVALISLPIISSFANSTFRVAD